MLYTWIPTDNELVWSSYIQSVELSIMADLHPSIEDFRLLLKNHLNSVAHRLESSVPLNTPSPMSIAYQNEKTYSSLFFQRVIRDFPHGWTLEVSR